MAVLSQHRFRPSHSNALVVTVRSWCWRAGFGMGARVLGEVLGRSAFTSRLLARALSDSNIDWGQALRLKLHGPGDPRSTCRTSAPALGHYHGIRCNTFPRSAASRTISSRLGKQIVAVSADEPQGVYLGDSDLCAWLRARTPVASSGIRSSTSTTTSTAYRLAEIYASYRARQPGQPAQKCHLPSSVIEPK